jgi:hypothetical protein
METPHHFLFKQNEAANQNLFIETEDPATDAQCFRTPNQSSSQSLESTFLNDDQSDQNNLSANWNQNVPSLAIGKFTTDHRSVNHIVQQNDNLISCLSQFND